MPTPSKQNGTSEFGVGQSSPPRSVFNNFGSSRAPSSQPSPPAGEKEKRFARRSIAPPRDVALHGDQHSLAPSDGERVQGEGNEAITDFPESDSRHHRQHDFDRALARSFIYCFLAKAFEYPDHESWPWLSSELTSAALVSASRAMSIETHADERAEPAFALEHSATKLLQYFRESALSSFESQYVASFGHGARGECPINEIEYGDLQADPLFQPHRLADLGAFYSAFGLELADKAAERLDHICVELEFASVLAAKEAYALTQRDADGVATCRDAHKKFLREHLGRWTPAFTRRLARAAGDTALGMLANFTQDFLLATCHEFGVTPGSQDLLLRPVNAASESLCASCGLNALPPGASQTYLE